MLKGTVYRSAPNGWTQIRPETHSERTLRKMKEKSVMGVSTWKVPSNTRNPITGHIRGKVYKSGNTTWVYEVWSGDTLLFTDNTGSWAPMLQDAYEGVWMVSQLYVFGYDLRLLKSNNTEMGVEG